MEQLFVRLTVRSHDEFDGRTAFVHPDDIRQVLPGHKMYKDKITTIDSAGVEKPTLCSVVRLTGAALMIVIETPAEIEQQIYDIRHPRGAGMPQLLNEDISPPKKRKLGT